MEVDDGEADKVACLMAVAVCCLAIPLLAHHSFGAEYDANKPITLTGVITKIEWTNPHSHFYLDVKDGKGTVANWKFEGYTSAVLYRTGWKKDITMKPGDTDDGLRVARARRRRIGRIRARSRLRRREEAVLRASGGYGRRRSCSCRGGAVMRGVHVAAWSSSAIVVRAVSISASRHRAPAKRAVPRAAGREAGSDRCVAGRQQQRGTWEEANGGSASAARARSVGARRPVVERPAGRPRGGALPALGRQEGPGGVQQARHRRSQPALPAGRDCRAPSCWGSSRSSSSRLRRKSSFFTST